MRAAGILLAVLLLGSAEPVALLGQSGNSAAKRSPAISLRKRLHVNPLITVPDTTRY
jgi:hypothetical protein